MGGVSRPEGGGVRERSEERERREERMREERERELISGIYSRGNFSRFYRSLIRLRYGFCLRTYL